MKFLVTGATGLLGSEVLSLLPSGSIGINSKNCDLIDSNKLITKIIDDNRIDAVFHCAARVGGLKANIDNMVSFFDDNVKINMNVLSACKEKNLKLVSVLSTCIYPDEQYITYPLTEEQLHIGPPHDSNFGYAYAKRMLEVQSRAYHQQYGCNFVNVIPNNLYGINDNYDLETSHVLPALIRKFYEAKIKGDKKVTVWGSGNPRREFTFARDAAQIIIWLMNNYDGIEPVNIGNPEQITIRDLAVNIAEEVNYKGQIEFDSSKPDGQYQKPSSNNKLKLIGWHGKYTPLREGIKEIIAVVEKSYYKLKGVVS